jgi:OmcA/MtrC family decaheme c-type cytochrome
MTASSAKVKFTLKNATGVPLDRTGKLTPDAVNVRFVLAQLGANSDGSAAQYTAYTTRVQTSPITQQSASQGTTESNGTFEALDVTQGSYEYTFSTALPGFDATKTQTVLAIASRGTAYDREMRSVRPDGGAVAAREVVSDANCASCHGEFAAHGGSYTKASQCVMCHNAGSTDPDTGNTVDFAVMLHKVHRGESLPSVVAGTPYQIIGYQQSVHDFSTVVFPTNIRNCESCHGGAQGDRWKTAAQKSACTSCHDNVVFATPVAAGKKLHSGGTQPDGVNCAGVCHPATGSLAGVLDKHYTLDLDPLAPKLAIAIDSMTNTAPGQLPVMQFTVTDKGVGRDLRTQPLTSLRATIAGPTSDFTSTLPTNGNNIATITPAQLVAIDPVNGVFSYTFTSAIPATATGTYQVALEAYWSPTCGNAVCDVGENGNLCPADCGAPISPTPASTPRFAALSPIKAFAVTGALAPRRTIVDADKCNGCHKDLSFHGGGRKNPNYCVMCHNPSLANTGRVSRFENSTVLAESVDFRSMIHKIHMGERLTQPYVLGGNPTPTVTNPAGTMHDFRETRYPRDPKQCAACHLANTWTLPLASDLQPSTFVEMTCTEPVGNDTNDYCDAPFWNASTTTKLPAQSTACTSCHDAPYAAAHAWLNTTPAGAEACATCHGPGAMYDASVFHGTP